MRMETAMSCGVIKSDNITVFDQSGIHEIPCSRSSNLGLNLWHGLVLHYPNVVIILVGVQGDLLLFASGGIHVVV